MREVLGDGTYGPELVEGALPADLSGPTTRADGIQGPVELPAPKVPLRYLRGGGEDDSAYTGVARITLRFLYNASLYEGAAQTRRRNHGEPSACTPPRQRRGTLLIRARVESHRSSSTLGGLELRLFTRATAARSRLPLEPIPRGANRASSPIGSRIDRSCRTAPPRCP